jgi:hypothetical protein
LAAGAHADPMAMINPEAWIAERLLRHREPPQNPIEQRLADGRWIMITERRTRTGGVVGVWMDITELKRREVAVVEAKEARKASSWPT